MVQFKFNLYYIVLKWGHLHSKSVPKELRKLIDLPRGVGKNVSN